MPSRMLSIRCVAAFAAALGALCATACVEQAPVAAGSAAEDTLDLETLDPALLHWVAPLAGDTVAADAPFDLTVSTQNAAALVVHFTIDGDEVAACDPSDPEQDCNDGDAWSYATSFDAPGHHTLGAYFVDAQGARRAITREIDVTGALDDGAEAAGLPPSPAADSTDPTATADLLEEGTGAIAQATTTDRGYLDPDAPMGWAGCHLHQRATSGGAERNTCAAPTGSHAACVQWAVQNGRVTLASGRLDGSTSHVDRCIQRYHRAIESYADLSYTSRADIAAWLAVTSNCEPRAEWHASLMSRARCVATARTLAGGRVRLSGAACAQQMQDNPDFAIRLAVAFVRAQAQRHGNDPPLFAATIARGLHPQGPGRNRWCVGAGRNSDRFISSFVAAYNAYHTWEDHFVPGALGGVLRGASVRLGAAIGPTVDCESVLGPAATPNPEPAAGDPATAAWRQCRRLTTAYAREGTTAFFWDHVVPCHLPGVTDHAMPASGQCAPALDAAGQPTYPFDWSATDAVIARAHRVGWNATVQANTLLYPQIPGGIQAELDALPAADRAARLEQRMVEYVTAAVRRYAGQGVEWSLINEVSGTNLATNALVVDGVTLHFDNVGAGRGFLDYFTPSQYLHAIEAVYHAAYVADPTAVLMTNEKQSEGMSDRSLNYRALISVLLRDGVPLHTIGFQGHVSSDPANTGYFAPASISDNLDLVSRLHIDPATGRPWAHLHPSVARQQGLRVQFTELGFRQTGLSAEVQRRYLYDVLSVCANLQRCDAATFWSVGDADAWDDTAFCVNAGTTCDAAAVFDTNYCPKPLQNALVAALQGQPYPAAAPAPACDF